VESVSDRATLVIVVSVAASAVVILWFMLALGWILH